MHKIPEHPVRYLDFDLALHPGGTRWIRRKIAPLTEAARFFLADNCHELVSTDARSLGRLGGLAK